MEQRSSQFSAPQTSRRATWFVSALVILVLISAVVLAHFTLQSARVRIMDDLDKRLSLPVQNRHTALTVWWGDLKNELGRLAQVDMFRLLATEVETLGNEGVKTMVALANAEQTSPADTREVARLASQLPLLRTQLEQVLSRRGDVLSATLLTPGMQPYLGTGAMSPDEQHWKERLNDNALALASRSVEQKALLASPVTRRGPDQLVMVISQPLFAPEYVMRSDDSPVGILLMTCDVTPIVRNATTARGFEHIGQAGYLVQQTPQGLEILIPDGDSAPNLLPGWKSDTSGALPLAPHTFLDNTAVYALGQAMPELGWIVVQDILQETVEQTYADQRQNILFTIAACTAIVLLLIGMFWWWFVGRRERAVADEMKKLYYTVNQQHQLLHGINSTMADALMMLDREGVVQYANDAFAAMANRGSEEMIGQTLTSSFTKQASDHILRFAGRVLRDNKAETFNKELVLAQGRRHFQIACSPFQREDGSVTGVVGVFRDLTDLIHAQKRAQTMIHQTVSVLVRAIEAVDPYLRGQSAHTGLLASQIARDMNLSLEHITTVRTAASLCKIGMIHLPRGLVNKTSALTSAEREELERHVEYAKASLEGIDFGLPVQETIYQMHEHLDGSGYPQHLKGDQISLNARILGTANTFCALVRPRSYRQAHTVEQALAIIDSSQYDPAVVHTLRDYLATAQGAEFLLTLQRKEDI